MVYYRKYRPQTVAELDLPSVRDKMYAILSSKDLPHAFLFTGDKGLGKTSSARILAKAINCEKKGKEPCNECMSCVSITNGSNIDVLEIDAASNGGVEEMRTLRERVKFAASSLKYKVYIIDEVHMLSTGAFNALLKTLEEPPSHVIFILATTELHKLPATVVSRTFQIQFEKPTNEQIAGSLERIVKGEKLKLEKDILLRVAQISDGAFRDAAKNLEELVLASNGEKITDETFNKVFRTHGLSAQVVELLKAYSARDAKKGLKTIQLLTDSGADFKIVIERMVDYLRGLLMIRNGIESDVTDIPSLSLENVNNLLELCNEAYAELKLSVIPSLPLELMTVRYCILDSGKNQEKTENAEESVKEVKTEVSVSSKLNSQENFLPALINELNKTNKPGAALLRSAKDAILVDNELVITTPFPIHADRLKSEKVLPDLKEASDKVVGQRVEVLVKTS